MNVLFVCHGNVARSQIAEAFFHYYSSSPATSAGIVVNRIGNLLKDEPVFIQTEIDLMRKHNSDISNYRRKLLSADMIEKADRIVVMLPQEMIPQDISKSSKAEIWQIPDPRNMNLQEWEQIILQIKGKVLSFIDENNLYMNYQNSSSTKISRI